MAACWQCVGRSGPVHHALVLAGRPLMLGLRSRSMKTCIASASRGSRRRRAPRPGLRQSAHSKHSGRALTRPRSVPSTPGLPDCITLKCRGPYPALFRPRAQPCALRGTPLHACAAAAALTADAMAPWQPVQHGRRTLECLCAQGAFAGDPDAPRGELRGPMPPPMLSMRMGGGPMEGGPMLPGPAPGQILVLAPGEPRACTSPAGIHLTGAAWLRCRCRARELSTSMAEPSAACAPCCLACTPSAQVQCVWLPAAGCSVCDARRRGAHGTLHHCAGARQRPGLCRHAPRHGPSRGRQRPWRLLRVRDMLTGAAVTLSCRAPAPRPPSMLGGSCCSGSDDSWWR